VALAAAEARGDAIGDFYTGKRVTLVIGYTAGGGYDQYARVFARYASRHIPGAPAIVPQNMPGASSRKAANWLYSAAAKDGTALAILGQNTALDQALGEDNVQFDARRFTWIGNMAEVNNVLAVWHTTGVNTIADARQKQLVIGATGASSPSVIYPQVSNYVLGTKFKIIAGYPGSAEIALAMERGEVDGRGSSSWSSWMATKPDWVREKKIVPLFQVGSRRDPAIGDVPLWSDLPQDADDRDVLAALSSSISIGYSIIGPPDIPSARVVALRSAFDTTLRDPAFLAEAKKQKMEINPISGDRVAEVVARTAGMSPAVVARIRGVLEAKDVTEKGK
jgi:tripartite-type tricarboxylate transporter receptor subunit TctC